MKKVFGISIIFMLRYTVCQRTKVDDDLLVDSIKADVTDFFIKEGLSNKHRVGNNRN